MGNEKPNGHVVFWSIIVLLAIATLAIYTGIGYVAGYAKGTLHGMRIERSWSAGIEKVMEPIVETVEEIVEPDRTRTFSEVTAEIAPHLAVCDRQVGGLKEWPLALAIAGAETNYCRDGVGSQRNCGGIKSKRPDRAFKVYDTRCDGLEDIVLTLRKPTYDGLSAGQDLITLGQIWCGHGDECLLWPLIVRSRLGNITGDIIYYSNEPLW